MVVKAKQLRLQDINVLGDNCLFILARYLIIFSIDIRNNLIYNVGYNRKKDMAIYADCESKRRARLKWRKSRKGQWWDYKYSQRPEVKARRKELYIQKIIKELANDRSNI